jgi:hypothetical protein
MIKYCAASLDLETRLGDVLARRTTMSEDISDLKLETGILKQLLTPGSPRHSFHAMTSGLPGNLRITPNEPNKNKPIGHYTADLSDGSALSGLSLRPDKIDARVAPSKDPLEIVPRDEKEQRFGSGWDLDFELDLL